VWRCLVKMNDSIEHSKVWITLLKTIRILAQSFGCYRCNIRSTGCIILVANLKNNLVELLFLSAVADVVVVVLDNSVLAFLLGVVLRQSFIEQLVINFPDIFFYNGNVVGNTFAVNIFCNEIAVVMVKVALSESTADCSFFDARPEAFGSLLL